MESVKFVFSWNNFSGNKYLTDTEPWKKQKEDPEAVKTILHLSLQICASLSVLCEPFLPFTAKKLQHILNIDNKNWQDGGRSDLLPAGSQLNPAEYLFEKIDDETIKVQTDRLERIKQENILKNFEPKEVAPIVSFDDFQKLDIRVGKVLACEKVKKADKLLKFTIDDDMKGRTIVSGIAKFYNPEDLVGKEVCFIANFAPRTLKGIESQGMILSAEDADGRLVVIGPHGEVRPGVQVG